jgi:hypothetical protein
MPPARLFCERISVPRVIEYFIVNDEPGLSLGYPIADFDGFHRRNTHHGPGNLRIHPPVPLDVRTQTWRDADGDDLGNPSQGIPLAAGPVDLLRHSRHCLRVGATQFRCGIKSKDSFCGQIPNSSAMRASPTETVRFSSAPEMRQKHPAESPTATRVRFTRNCPFQHIAHIAGLIFRRRPDPRARPMVTRRRSDPQTGPTDIGTRQCSQSLFSIVNAMDQCHPCLTPEDFAACRLIVMRPPRPQLLASVQLFVDPGRRRLEVRWQPSITPSQARAETRPKKRSILSFARIVL